jgi:pantoate--beta-alanine ligase
LWLRHFRGKQPCNEFSMERLTAEHQEEASFIYELWSWVPLWQRKLIDQVEEIFTTPSFRLEYFQIADEETLLQLDKKIDTKPIRPF